MKIWHDRKIFIYKPPKNETFISKKLCKNPVSDFWNVHWKLRMQWWHKKDRGVEDASIPLSTKPTTTINNYRLEKIPQSKLWTTTKNSKNPAELKNRGWSQRKEQETYYTCHPILHFREAWSQEGQPQRNCTPCGKGEQENPSNLTTADICTCGTEVSLWLLQCQLQLIELPRVVHWILHRAGTVAVVRHALRGPSCSCVHNPGITTAQHLTIYWTGTATALRSTPTPDQGSDLSWSGSTTTILSLTLFGAVICQQTVQPRGNSTFLETYNLPRLHHVETENLNKTITRRLNEWSKMSHHSKFHNQMISLVNSTKYLRN